MGGGEDTAAETTETKMSERIDFLKSESKRTVDAAEKLVDFTNELKEGDRDNYFWIDLYQGYPRNVIEYDAGKKLRAPFDPHWKGVFEAFARNHGGGFDASKGIIHHGYSNMRGTYNGNPYTHIVIMKQHITEVVLVNETRFNFTSDTTSLDHMNEEYGTLVSIDSEMVLATTRMNDMHKSGGASIYPGVCIEKRKAKANRFKVQYSPSGGVKKKLFARTVDTPSNELLAARCYLYALDTEYKSDQNFHHLYFLDATVAAAAAVAVGATVDGNVLVAACPSQAFYAMRKNLWNKYNSVMQKNIPSDRKARVHTVLGIQPEERKITTMFAPAPQGPIIRRVTETKTVTEEFAVVPPSKRPRRSMPRVDYEEEESDSD